MISTTARQSLSAIQPGLRRWLHVAPLWAGLVSLHLAAADLPSQSGPGFRWRALQFDPAGRAGFRRLGAEITGISFTNHLSDADGAANRVLENGSGVAAGDFDGDGLTDLFLPGLAGNSALYRNLGGWGFTNVTTSVGLALSGEVGRGAVFADLNGDRRPDLLVSTLARGVRCFLNEGGRFRDATAEAGTGGFRGATTLALADVNGDGTPDLYVTRYRADDIRDSSNVEARRIGGRTELHPKYAGRLIVGPTGLIEFGEPDVLLLNDGHARFREVPWTSGAFLDEEGRVLEASPRDWGLTASFRDVNDDGLPDLYVCNDYWTPDRLWLNAGNGRFRLAPGSSLRHTSENSMGVDFADLDRDGYVDFVVTDMLDPDPRIRRRQAMAQTPIPVTPGEILNRPQIMRNTCFRGRGDGTFAEIAEFAGLGTSGWSWQPLLVDVDLDGFEDLIVPAGHRRDVQDLDATERIRSLQHAWPATMDPASRQQAFTRELTEHGRLYPPLASPVRAYRNLGGFRFIEVTRTWALDEPGVHQGGALVDLDGDGDLDLVINNLNAPPGLYRNDGPGHRLAVRLRGTPPDTDAIGARVRVRGGAVPLQTQEVVAGGRYLSGSELTLVFAAGAPTNRMSLEVTWRDGRSSVIEGVLPDRFYELDAAGAVAARPPPAASPAPLFEDASDRLRHAHHEDAFDDFARQPLLHRRLSQGGPGIAVADLNGDGWPDLLIGAGSGGALSVLTNDTRGGFGTATGLFPALPASGDQSGLVTYRAAAAVRVLVAENASGDSAAGGLAVREASTEAGSAAQPLPGGGTSAGPLALGDLDGDGRLDLFVGGAVIGGRYPESAPSLVYRRETAGWRRDEDALAALRGVGLVNGAVWGDLDGDGAADLVLACEWSPLRVFRNQAGRLQDVTREWGFEAFSGWWQGVTLGDLDDDGRLDIVAANWGLNSAVTASAEHPAVLAFGDLLDRGVVDLLETEWDPLRGVLAPRRRLNELEAALPPLRGAFPVHHAFVERSLDDVIRHFDRPVRRLEARTLASTAFLNRGGRFEPRPLPPEAQYSPAFGVLVADFDGDGREDVFLAQNCFALPWHVPRLDAGRGLLLQGRGDGNFEPMDPGHSGIRVDGEQRGAAFADFDGDGRLDLVVGQNAAETKLLLNRRAAPGVRVRLRGRPENPDGIGAVMRVRTASGMGTARAVLAGSGWWSQSSPVLVMSVPRSPAEVVVRWPGGRVSEASIPAGASEVEVAEGRAGAAAP